MSTNGLVPPDARVTRRLPAHACRRATALDARVPGDGIVAVVQTGETLEITYDLRETSLDALIDALDFDIDALGPCERALVGLERHRERVRVEELKYIGGWDNIVREIYVTHYRHRAHGRRDDRRRQWRQYEQQADAPPATPFPEEPDDG